LSTPAAIQQFDGLLLFPFLPPSVKNPDPRGKNLGIGLDLMAKRAERPGLSPLVRELHGLET
jgi:hypothetical protein